MEDNTLARPTWLLPTSVDNTEELTLVFWVYAEIKVYRIPESLLVHIDPVGSWVGVVEVVEVVDIKSRNLDLVFFSFFLTPCLRDDLGFQRKANRYPLLLAEMGAGDIVLSYDNHYELVSFL
jgi:hypothetical protein